jgi:cation transport ATPase
MLLNVIGFNLSWFGLILIGNEFIPLALVFLCSHFYQVKQKKCELKLVFTVAILGIFVDFLLVYNGLYSFNNQVLPVWLMVLWACFAATITTSLSFLKSSILFQISAGALLAPISYLAAANLSVITFNYSTLIVFITLAFFWAPLMVLFFYLAKKYFPLAGVND